MTSRPLPSPSRRSTHRIFRRMAFDLATPSATDLGSFHLKAARLHGARQAPQERAVVVDDQQARHRHRYGPRLAGEISWFCSFISSQSRQLPA